MNTLKVTEDKLRQAVELMESGASQKDACRKCGFSTTALRAKVAKHPELQERMRAALNRLHWDEATIKRCVELTGHGLNDRQIAARLDISEYAMQQARSRNTELRTAMDEVRRQAHLQSMGLGET